MFCLHLRVYIPRQFEAVLRMGVRLIKETNKRKYQNNFQTLRLVHLQSLYQ